jgi:hypothetical protein
MSGDHLAGTIDQNRNIEAEGFDAIRDLPDLFFAVDRGLAESGFSASTR